MANDQIAEQDICRAAEIASALPQASSSTLAKLLDRLRRLLLEVRRP